MSDNGTEFWINWIESVETIQDLPVDPDELTACYVSSVDMAYVFKNGVWNHIADRPLTQPAYPTEVRRRATGTYVVWPDPPVNGRHPDPVHHCHNMRWFIFGLVLGCILTGVIGATLYGLIFSGIFVS